jgi:hypothetical protein
LQTEHAGAVDERVGFVLGFDQRAFEVEGFREVVEMRFAFSTPTTSTSSSNFGLSKFGELAAICTRRPFALGSQRRTLL